MKSGIRSPAMILWVLVRYECANVVRGRSLFALAAGLFALTEVILFIGPEENKAVISLLNIFLLALPVLGLLFSLFYWYHHETFSSVLLSQPLSRHWIPIGRWLSISICLVGALVVPPLISIVLHFGWSARIGLLGGISACLILTFSGFGIFLGTCFSDRLKGVAAAFAIWFYLVMIHDSVMFFLLTHFNQYPIELPALAFMALNPIDLGRMLMLLTYDYHSLMGYVGALVSELVSQVPARIALGGVFIAWVLLPISASVWRFRTKDLS